MGFGSPNLLTHAPRWEIRESALGIPHEEIRIATDDGRKLSAWYVPSRNGAAVLVSHGSGGSRGRLPRHVRMLARHGYGVLALDNPGNGESDGHSNGLGDNAQPALDAGLDYLERRPDVDPDRIAGFGLSLGGEVVLEAASHDRRLAAVVADGAARPQDAQRAVHAGPLERAMTGLQIQSVRAISGMEPSHSLIGMMPAIAPRPVLLVAAGRVPEEPKVARLYQRAGGSSVQTWEVPGAAHTGGLRKHPAEYERRTVGFLDAALKMQRLTPTSAVGHSFGKVFFRLLALSPRVLRGSVISAYAHGYRRRSARWELQSRGTPTGWTRRPAPASSPTSRRATSACACRSTGRACRARSPTASTTSSRPTRRWARISPASAVSSAARASSRSASSSAAPTACGPRASCRSTPSSTTWCDPPARCSASSARSPAGT